MCAREHLHVCLCMCVYVLIFLFWLIKNALLKLDEFSSRARKSLVLKTPNSSTKMFIKFRLFFCYNFFSYFTSAISYLFLTMYIIIICIYTYLQNNFFSIFKLASFFLLFSLYFKFSSYINRHNTTG